MTKKELELVKVYKRSIDQLKITYDNISINHHNIRNRVLTYLGAGFALFGYLYADCDRTVDIYKRLFIPPQIYGIIFYFLGLFAGVIAIAILIIAMKPVVWRYPTDACEHLKIGERYKNELDFLRYIRDEYIEAIKINLGHNNQKWKYLNIVTPLLITSAILLLIIKFFN